MTSIAVFGAGGIGGYFGGRFAQAGADVLLIARGAHLTALRERGLRVESIHGDFEVDLSATDDPAEIGPVDYVLVTVKSFDTTATARALDPLLHDETAVISLQNGVDNEEKLAREIDAEHVLGGVAYIFSTIGDPGVIEHTSGPARIIFGELDGARSECAERFLELCTQADIDAELSTDIQRDMWEKFAFICAQSGMTAATRLPIGAIREVPESWVMFRELLEDVVAVAEAEGVDVSDDLIDRWLEFATDLDADSYSSLHYDMTHEKRMELKTFHGTIVRLADDYDLPVSMSRAVYSILRPWAVRNDIE